MDKIELAKTHASTLATFVAVAIGAALFIWGYANNGNVYDISLAVIAGCIGLISYSIVYVLMYAAINRWPDIFPNGIEVERPEIIDQAAAIVETAVTAAASTATNADYEPPVMFNAGGKWRIKAGGKLMLLDEARIQREHIELIHTNKPENPSLNKLHDIGISRFQKLRPNAQSVIEWLEENDLAGGGRWTELGEMLFGLSPTEM